MSTMQHAVARSSGIVTAAYATAESMKAAGILDLSPSPGMAQFGQFKNDGANRERYSLFRGWLYSAVNALAAEAAGQPVVVAKLKGKRAAPGGKKLVRQKMTSTARTKTAGQEFEVLMDHGLIDHLEQPNPIQTRWSFVYSFVANINITGWGYVVGGENDDGIFEFYSLPTTWIKPDHRDGPFSRFKVVDPQNPTASMDDSEWLTRENVAFAMLPNPVDPRASMPPAQSQIQAIRIDDCIQASQQQFFDNGIFPGAIVTIGKDPHPDVPGGMRPRLSAAQRRQVMGAIRKVMTGVANYGNPAIVDGMIESIERLSMQSNEMGWEGSEKTARTRILSAFSVHPYILGEPVGVGGYAQVANIEKRFYKRVNTFLDMLGTVMTNFVGPAAGGEDDLLVWWEECQALDPGLRWGNLNAARSRGDVSKNEIRAELGLPPDETGGDMTKSYAAGDLNAIVAVQAAVAQGAMEPQQAAEIYRVCFDMDPADAKKIAGKKPPKPEVPPQLPPGAGPPAPPEEEEPASEEEAVEQASKALELAVKALGLTVSCSGLPDAVADKIIEVARS